MECPKCSCALPTARVKFCPRCGAPISSAAASAPAAKPIRLEKRGTLINPFFIGSVALVLVGTLVAAEGQLRIGIILLAIGLPALLITTARSLVR